MNPTEILIVLLYILLTCEKSISEDETIDFDLLMDEPIDIDSLFELGSAVTIVCKVKCNVHSIHH